MHGRRAKSAFLVTLTLLGAGSLASLPAVEGAAQPLGPDFNGDGYADLAVGVPGEDIIGVDDAGAVAVIYGTANGLNGDRPVDDQLWCQGCNGLLGIRETYDAFGSALAAGDFDGDGFDDLAIGVPGEGVSLTSGGEVDQAGSVHVLYGSGSGLDDARNQVLTQETPGIEGSVTDYDHFGAALVAADFGHGGYDDLAIGSPRETFGAILQAGVVDVLYGSASGITTSGAQRWDQNRSGIVDVAEAKDQFGYSLAAGDVGRSAHADLIVGVPYEDVSGHQDAGAVAVIYGSTDGLNSTGNQLWHQDSPDIAGVAEAGDQFGRSVVAADFGNGSRGDLAVGAPYEDAGGATDAGSVNVIFGSTTGLTATSDQLWYQGTVGIEGDPEGGDQFGFSVAAGDFGKTSHRDLAVGAPGEDQEDASPDDKQAGAVNVIYGSPTGLIATGDQFWWQDSPGIEGETEGNDRVGTAVATGNYGRDGHADLAIGACCESESDFYHDDAGAVNVIYGTDAGLAATGDQFWWQASDALRDSADDVDRFGEVLAR